MTLRPSNKRTVALAFLMMFGVAFIGVAHAQTVAGIANAILDQIIKPMITFLLIAASLVFIYGVIEYIAKSDSDEGRSTGRRHMIWGIVGLIIMVSAASIVEIVSNFWDTAG